MFAETLTNHVVIIPKLGPDFVISGFVVGDPFGTLVQLLYSLDPLGYEILNVRVGQYG